MLLGCRLGYLSLLRMRDWLHNVSTYVRSNEEGAVWTAVCISLHLCTSFCAWREGWHTGMAHGKSCDHIENRTVHIQGLFAMFVSVGLSLPFSG